MTTTNTASAQLHFLEYSSCLQEVLSGLQHDHSVSGWLLQDYSLPVPLRGHLQQRKYPQMILKLHSGSFQESCVAIPTKAQLPCPSAGSRRKVWKVVHNLACTALPAVVPPWAGSSKSWCHLPASIIYVLRQTVWLGLASLHQSTCNRKQQGGD